MNVNWVIVLLAAILVLLILHMFNVNVSEESLAFVPEGEEESRAHWGS